MKFSYNWIRELIDGLEDSARDLSRSITMKTAECEGVEPAGAHLTSVCTARVLSVEPAGSGHNRKAVVQTGRWGIKTVVCGAPNCRPGIVTAYVPPGVRLGEREIGIAAIDGVTSEGMLASGAELGLNRDEAGILELGGEAGCPIPGCAPDFIIEIDNKSITHRPDLWGHLGMAREVAAFTRRPLIDPVKTHLLPEGESPARIAIEDPVLCPRYSALVFDNVKVGPSPLWLQYRLESIGLNPINNIVDVTNFVMAEIAQPMHAFDAATLKGDTIFIRSARAGEHVLALNGERYALDESNLVIADAGGPIALAGVIGGLDTGIGGGTTRIVLESACFKASSIRRTSSKLKLRTDASMRFEKSQDPVNTVRGLARAIELLEQVSPGIRLAGGLADAGRPIAPAPPILLPLEWLDRKLGKQVPRQEVREILQNLSFGVSELEPGLFSVSVPSWRATKDISIKDDLVEEVGRIVGYASIVPVAPQVAAVPPPVNDEREFQHHVRDLTAAQGFTEVYNYSFISEERAREFGLDPDSHVRVANPIAENQGLMRRTLVPGIRANIVENCKHFDSFRLFEIGQEIHRREEGLPDEVPHLAAATCNKDEDPAGAAGLFEMKRLAECLMPGSVIRPSDARLWEHPARAADVSWQGEIVGRLFEFHPAFVPARAAVLDVDLRLMQRLTPALRRCRPIRRYPSSAFDLSVVAGLRELVGDIGQRLAALAGPELIAIEFVRQYSGPPLPDDRKSVSYRMTVGAPDRTLSSEEVGGIRGRIIDGMREAGYELRV